MDNLLEIVEAIIFASGSPLKRDDILRGLPEEISKKDLNGVITKLQNKYSGDSGILLLSFNDKVQFTTNPAYGTMTSDILQKQKEKELTKILMEVLAIVAYSQPITRLEIEDIRGTNSDYAISVLLSVNLIQSLGRKDTLGRPTLYGTTDEFLKKFKFTSLNELPGMDEINARLKEMKDSSYGDDSLYKNVSVDIEDKTGFMTNKEIREKREIDTANKRKELEKFDNRMKDIDDFLGNIDVPEFIQDKNFDLLSMDELKDENSDINSDNLEQSNLNNDKNYDE